VCVCVCVCVCVHVYVCVYMWFVLRFKLINKKSIKVENGTILEWCVCVCVCLCACVYVCSAYYNRVLFPQTTSNRIHVLNRRYEYLLGPGI